MEMPLAPTHRQGQQNPVKAKETAKAATLGILKRDAYQAIPMNLAFFYPEEAGVSPRTPPLPDPEWLACSGDG